MIGVLRMKLGKLNIVLAAANANERLLFKDAFNDVRVAHTLTIVTCGDDLINHLKQTRNLPHLIFVDLNMPGKTGMECLKLIRANKMFREMAVAVYTSSASGKALEDAFTAGANIFIKKPSDFAALKKIIVDVISVSRLYITDGLNRESFMVSYLEDDKDIALIPAVIKV
jgi:CheY-like chemotaxis protein